MVCGVLAKAGDAVCGVAPSDEPSTVTARPCGFESIVYTDCETGLADGRTYVALGCGVAVGAGVAEAPLVG
jgi:hypothetical protein